jgi:hypothetical protein
MRAVFLGIFFCSLSVLSAQDSAEAFGQAVKESLRRSRELYPDSARPGTALSQAILFRIDWLSRNNPNFFSDPDWPVKIAAAEAERIGTGAPPVPTPAPAADPADRRYLAMVTKNFSVTGAAFRKGQQIVIEALRDHGKRGVVLVDGQPILLFLDYVKLVRELEPGEGSPLTVRIISARYGLPDTKGYVVSGAVQTSLTPNSTGGFDVAVSDALLPASTAQRLNRAAGSQAIIDPVSGQPISTPNTKILSVVYEIGGVEKTRQAEEGETLTLD